MYDYIEETYEDSFLEHHGILGQKWGIRRFQNYDGTLKAAGKRRAKTDRDKERAERKAAKAEKKEAKAQAKAEKKEAKEEEARKNLRSEIDKAIANVDFKKISELKGQMTDDDLLKLSKRAQALGKTAENLDKYKKGLPPSTFDKVIKGLGAVKTGADAVANAHKAFKDLRKEFGLDAASILNDNSDGQMTLNDWARQNKEPDIFDRIKETTGKIAKDAANKASEKYQEKKLQSQLKEASNRIKDNETLDWLEKLNGGKKESSQPKANFDSGFKLKEGDWSMFKGDSSTPKSAPASTPTPAKPKANFDSGFKLGDGDYSIFSSSAARNTKVSDISKPSAQTQKTIDRLIKKGSGVGDVSISDVNDELLRRNNSRLGL